MRIAIIGAGAAGCFCAISLKREHPSYEVDVFESSEKPLKKVALTGGGRCNLTNTFQNLSHPGQAYPRGEKLMKRILRAFSPRDTMEWFEKEGIELITEADQRVFPRSQNAMEVVDTLQNAMRKEHVRLHPSHRLEQIIPRSGQYGLLFGNGRKSVADKVIITCGGLSRWKEGEKLFSLDIDIVKPVPSLFSFRIEDGRLRELAGTTIARCTAGITGSKFRSEGNILITHRGMSGPAILKLSSYAARLMAESSRQENIGINWMGTSGEEEVRQWISHTISLSPHKHTGSITPERLTSRFWKYLLERSGISSEIPYNALNPKQTNRLAATLTHDVYPISGRDRNKEEFVTCGGVSLSEVSPLSLESKTYPGVFLAGEILDIDAITGGFNLQAAWSTAHVVARHVEELP